MISVKQFLLRTLRKSEVIMGPVCPPRCAIHTSRAHSSSADFKEAASYKLTLTGSSSEVELEEGLSAAGGAFADGEGATAFLGAGILKMFAVNAAHRTRIVEDILKHA